MYSFLTPRKGVLPFVPSRVCVTSLAAVAEVFDK